MPARRVPSGCTAWADLGGFGADQLRWPILTDNGVECVAGNYDAAIARADPDCGCGYRDPKDNAFAQLIYDHTLATTGRLFAAWMGPLPTQRRETLEGVDVHLVHGSPLAPNDFWWESLPDSGAPPRRRGLRGRDRAAAPTVACPGSDASATLSWSTSAYSESRRTTAAARSGTRSLDLADGHVAGELIPLAYDWAAQAASMGAAQLPEPFVETIETGWWTTCLDSCARAERSRGRYHLYRTTLPSGLRPAADGWGETAAQPSQATGRSSHSSAPRTSPPGCGCTRTSTAIWPATTAPSPPHRRHRPRPALRLFPALSSTRLYRPGFTELYLTGGEPFIHPGHHRRPPRLRLRRAAALVRRMTTRCSCEACLAAGLADHPNRTLTVQSSLDGATPAPTHDVQAGFPVPRSAPSTASAT